MKILNRILILVLLGISSLFSGCFKPVDVPEYKEVQSNETAFVIPLEGGVQNQTQLDSEKYLEQKKVSQKRIQVPHRWSQTGRFDHEGEWIDTIRVLTVDRSPVTREWKPKDPENKDTRVKDEAIWLESADSIGFSTGFSVSAYIEESDTARFLYSYKSTSLAAVLDSELKARVQATSSDVAGRMKLDILREKKDVIMSSIKADVIPFFKERGITITTIGMFGGFTYENKAIQDAIDKTFIAQQEKVVAAAQLLAQTDKNAKIEMEARALAQAAQTKSNGEAEGKKLVFAAEADGIRSVNKALSEANQNPLLIQLKALEVETKRVEKWNGTVPQWIMGGSGGEGSSGQPFIFQIPAVTK